MKKLTEKQQQYLDICNQYYDKYKKYPKAKELAEHFKCTESNAIQKLNAIRSKGYL